MGFSCGIVGLPNVGKSTLFNSLSSAKAEAANFPFCTIEPNVGIVTVPDARVEALAKVCDPDRKVYSLHLSADGRFLGGMIVPGPALMRRSLDRGTAGLRLTEGVFADFPASTPDAITTGAIQACAGAIERMRDAMAGAGCPPSQIVISGGAAPELAAHLPIAATIRENLVLDGLLLIARSD